MCQSLAHPSNPAQIPAQAVPQRELRSQTPSTGSQQGFQHYGREPDPNQPHKWEQLCPSPFLVSSSQPVPGAGCCSHTWAELSSSEPPLSWNPGEQLLEQQESCSHPSEMANE